MQVPDLSEVQATHEEEASASVPPVVQYGVGPHPGFVQAVTNLSEEEEMENAMEKKMKEEMEELPLEQAKVPMDLQSLFPTITTAEVEFVTQQAQLQVEEFPIQQQHVQQLSLSVVKREKRKF